MAAGQSWWSLRALYDGVEEPIDPVAGHISGAINMPLTDVISGANSFLGNPCNPILAG